MGYKDYGWSEAETDSHSYLVPTIIRAMKNCGINLQAAILDAGCGGGHVLSELCRRGYRNIAGFDASESGIDVAKKSFPHIRERFAVHDAYDATMPDTLPARDYDLILSVEVIEHLYDPRAYLSNLYSWLRPGGHVIITTPYHGYAKNVLIALLGRFDQHVNPLWDGGHVKFYSRRTLAELIKEAGFTVSGVFGSGRIPYVWKSMVMVGRK